MNQVKAYANSVMGTDNRASVREKLFASLSGNRYVPSDYTTGSVLWANRHRLGIRDDWSYEPLQKGQLVLFAGRLVYQKG